MFDFHKLTVYTKVRDINNLIFSKVIHNHSIHKSLKDQLIRSSSSTALNIAEGSGRSTQKDKRNFYIIAKGSLYESVALLDILLDQSYIESKVYDYLYKEYEEATRMLFGLIRSLGD